MLSFKTTGLLLILVVISFINNAKRFDYNSPIALGLIFISSKNPYLYRMYCFYLLVVLTIFVDGISIALLSKNIDAFHAIVIPVL